MTLRGPAEALATQMPAPAAWKLVPSLPGRVACSFAANRRTTAALTPATAFYPLTGIVFNTLDGDDVKCAPVVLQLDWPTTPQLD